MEIENAVNQAQKELANRFDFKGSNAEITPEKNEIKLATGDQFKMRALVEIVSGGSPSAASASRAWTRASRSCRRWATPGRSSRSMPFLKANVVEYRPLRWAVCVVLCAI